MFISSRPTRLVVAVLIGAAALGGGINQQAHSAPAAIFRPIGLPTPLPVVPSGPLTAPGISPLQASASAVTVKWSDESDNELGFKVFRRDTSGNWQLAYQIATSDVRGVGASYSWVDTSTDLSGQCYMVTAFNSNDAAGAAEECTVRPDPNRFPQTLPVGMLGWTGLSDANDGSGSFGFAPCLSCSEQYLRYADREFGPNLEWANSSLWRVEAQGGPHLMKGQAVALKVWGGGWLEYGHETFGVDLKLSSTPVYQWYVIGDYSDFAGHDVFSIPARAGADLTNGPLFALWNSSSHRYLIPGDQTFGVGLTWASGTTPPPAPTPTPTQQGVQSEHVYNCSDNQQPVEVFINDLSAGGAFVDEGSLNSLFGSDDGCPPNGVGAQFTFSPHAGHVYNLVATDSTLVACDGGNDPTDGQCQAMSVTFSGAANGCTETDVVGGETMNSCSAVREQ